MPPRRGGCKLSEETKRKISEAMKTASLRNKNRFSGGDYNWYHAAAHRLFGKDACEDCGMTNQQHIQNTGRRLHMHCQYQQYHKMEPDLWETLCAACHLNRTRKENPNVNGPN